MTSPAVRRVSPLAAAALLLLGTGCDQALFIDMDIENVCLELPAQDVPVGAGAAIVGDVVSHVTTTVDTSTLWPEDVTITEADLRIKSATFRSTQVGASVDFIRQLTLTAQGGTAGGAGRSVTVFDWTHPAGQTGLTEIALGGAPDENLYSLTEGGELTVKLDFVMAVPPADVQVIPVLCFRVQARMDYGEAL